MQTQGGGGPDLKDEIDDIRDFLCVHLHDSPLIFIFLSSFVLFFSYTQGALETHKAIQSIHKSKRIFGTIALAFLGPDSCKVNHSFHCNAFERCDNAFPAKAHSYFAYTCKTRFFFQSEGNLTIDFTSQ